MALAHTGQHRPTFFIVGAARAGTTSLNNYLDHHPDIFMSAVKEPHYYSRVAPTGPGRNFFVTFDEKGYMALFNKAGSARAIGESSTSYLWSPEAPGRIRAAHPDSKIVILLRDPIARAYSHYLADVKECVEKQTFCQAIHDELAGERKDWPPPTPYVAIGRYAEQVTRYLDTFGSNVLVLIFEEFVRETRAHLVKTVEFLGLDPACVDAIPRDAHNAYSLPRNRLVRAMLGSGRIRRAVRAVVPFRLRAAYRNTLYVEGTAPELSDEARDLLAGAYADEYSAVRDVLGRDLPWQ